MIQRIRKLGRQRAETAICLFGEGREEPDGACCGRDEDFVIGDCGCGGGVEAILGSGEEGGGLGAGEEGEGCGEVAA